LPSARLNNACHCCALLRRSRGLTVALAGTRGYTGLRRFLVGSTSSCVVESEAARSCLVVRRSLRHAACGAQQPEEEASADITTPPRDHGRVVAIAVDGSSAGMALVLYCRQFLLRATDKVFVVHGRPDTPKTDDELTATDVAIAAVNAAVAALHQMRDELLVAPCAALLAEGNVRDELVNFVESNDADVLVVGSRGLGNALKRAVMGSVSSYAVQHAGCAVLVVSAPTLKALAQAEAAEAEAADATKQQQQQQQDTAEAH
jgi:nucleotide-binding universal stress UspA family protein